MLFLAVKLNQNTVKTVSYRKIFSQLLMSNVAIITFHLAHTKAVTHKRDSPVGFIKQLLDSDVLMV